MGRAPCCSKVGLHRGPWSAREDALLMNYIQTNGEGNWRSLPKNAGLLRCGKSCRLRWMNYLRPDIKRGNISPEEEDLIMRMHALLGNRWSLIAGRIPGRTDNEIKNYWNTHLSKRRLADQTPHKKISNKRSKKHYSNIEKEKARIYIPKPTRLACLSRNASFDWTSSSHEQAAGTAGLAIHTQVVTHPNNTMPLSNTDDNGGFLMPENDDDLVKGLEHMEYSGNTTTTTGLENMYEEYLRTLLNAEEDDQLLLLHDHLDSFAIDV